MKALLIQGLSGALLFAFAYSFVTSSPSAEHEANRLASGKHYHANAVSDTPLSTEQLDMLLAGGDPSTLLPPTAAGGNTEKLNCKTGRIEMPENDPGDLHGSLYIALETGTLTYIQPLPFKSITLVQAPYQSVTADSVQELPEPVRRTFEQLLASLSSCENTALYLASVSL